MKISIPKEIEELLIKQAPSLKYVEGKGRVLVDDAPLEIVKSREITSKWFSEHYKER